MSDRRDALKRNVRGERTGASGDGDDNVKEPCF